MFTRVCLFVLALCGASIAAEGDEVVLRGVGASFPDPLYQRWIELYCKTPVRVGYYNYSLRIALIGKTRQGLPKPLRAPA